MLDFAGLPNTTKGYRWVFYNNGQTGTTGWQELIKQRNTLFYGFSVWGGGGGGKRIFFIFLLEIISSTR